MKLGVNTQFIKIKITALLFLMAMTNIFAQISKQKVDSIKVDTIKSELKYPFDKQSGGLYLDNSYRYEATYDPKTNLYLVYQKIGNTIVSEPIYFTQKEYVEFLAQKNTAKYYKEKSQANDDLFRSPTNSDNKSKKGLNALRPSIKIKSKLFETLFGGNKIELIPQGNVSFDLGILAQQIDNPQLLPRQRNTLTMDIKQRMQLNILAKVGENLQFKANYDTQAGFAFENRLNLGWKGKEDNIIKSIEFGNVNLPLSTSLISGSQALFGLKTQLQFGKTFVTGVYSEQQSESKNIVVQGGGAVSTYKIRALDYQENQNYFLGQYFRNNYDTALKNYPIINSGINITKIEVWKIDTSNANLGSQRSVLAVRDLGGNTSSTGTPSNAQGGLYNSITGLGTSIRDAAMARNTMINNGYTESEQFLVHGKVRKLATTEYTYNPNLGYITLNQQLQAEQLLAVSYQYTVNGSTTVYKVGEMSDEQSGVLIAEMLKSNVLSTSSPMWNLMMKNIYSLDAYQIDKKDFQLNVMYKDPNSGLLNYLPTGPVGVKNNNLISVLNLDRLNGNNDLVTNTSGQKGDGIFDFIPGITVDANSGRIIFTQVEPFGKSLQTTLSGDASAISTYVFNDLYTKQKADAEQSSFNNRYFLQGKYKGSSGDGIFLGAINVPQGSVRVTANGKQLEEGVDYTVDYQIGKVLILNQILKDSGVPINVSLESQSTFNVQKKKFMGVNVEHKFNKNFSLGGTVINYLERPLTQKAQYGTEPVNNTMLGINAQYNTKSTFLTRLVDKIPLIDTNVMSSINIKGEAAYLMPGTNSYTQNQSYIDDFENTQSKISLKDDYSWSLASTPATFTNGTLNDNLQYGFNRGLITWYSIDTRFYPTGSATVDKNEISKNLTRRVEVKELYPKKDLITGNAKYLSTFDVSFFPEEKGPYNYDTATETPNSRWGGIMRSLSVTNFKQANIDYVEFWLMDPFADNTGSDGKLLIQIGNVSEDILKDGNLQYENGLPYGANQTPINTTNWGNQPKNPSILYGFQTIDNQRTQQDVGLDGLSDVAEAIKFSGNNFVNPVTGVSDASNDNYLFFLDSKWDTSPLGTSLVNRYRYYKNTDNNSPSGSLNSGSTIPDTEDANRDSNLDQIENYNQYTVSIKAADFQNVGSNFIVDKKTTTVTLPNNQIATTNWYQIRIPVTNFDAGGSLDILNSARYMRVLMKDFSQTTTLRFGTFDLVRSDWRRYAKNISPLEIPNAEGTDIVDITNLEIGAVNLEENSKYVLPPTITREQLQANTGTQSQNEQSLYLLARKLGGTTTLGDARGVFKNLNLDLRRYKNLKMYVHAEDLDNINSANLDTNTKVFMRLGSDLSENYYEYEAPLKFTSTNATATLDIWPQENNIDLTTQSFVDAKNNRDITQPNNTTIRYAHAMSDPSKKIYVKGRPSLGNITSIMIGIRNTQTGGVGRNILLWANELRLSGIDNEGGYAANLGVGITLADFAQISATGNISSIGFGAIDQGPTQRSQNQKIQYTVNSSINLDKFTPKKWGVSLPLQVSYGESFIDPKYNPLDTDVKFNNSPNKAQLKDIVRTYSEQRSVGFANISKTRGPQAVPSFYDIENLSLSWLYADDYYRDLYTSYNINQNFKTSLSYNYTFSAITIEPFKSINFFNNHSKYFNFIKAFNFNPIPSRISFRADINRTYNEQQYRDINQYIGGGAVQLAATYSNKFLFNWQYNLGFDLTKSLRLDFTSTTNTLVENNQFNIANQSMIWKNITQVGRPIIYNHQLTANWTTPIKLLPFMDWANVDLGYTAGYNWQARSSAYKQDGLDLGNLVQNQNTINAAGTFDFNSFYRKFNRIKRLESTKQRRKFELDSVNAKFVKDLKSNKSGGKLYKIKTHFKFTDYLLLPLTSLKKLQANYAETNGIALPGFLSEPNLIGQGKANGSTFIGPSLGYLFGSQFDIKKQAIEQGWVTGSNLLTDPYVQTHSQDITGSAYIEPFSNLRIDLSFKRNLSTRAVTTGYNVDADTTLPGFQNAFVNETVTYNSTVINLGSSFERSESLYKKITENAKIISNRLGTNTQANGYADGYNITNSEVLLPAFLAAYSKTTAKGADLGYKKDLPLPNWKIIYSGLINTPFISKYFLRFDINHSYNSSYTVTGIQSNINYFSTPATKDSNGDYYTKNTYGSVSVVESFSPLLGFDMSLRNNLQLRAQYNKDRIASLSLSNRTLTEDSGSELIVGLGYIMRDVKIKLFSGETDKPIKGDLNIRGDLSIRDNETKIRRLIIDDTQITGGQRVFSLRASADYNFNKNFNLKLFYEQVMTSYKVSTSFPLSTIRAGISATLLLGN